MDLTNQVELESLYNKNQTMRRLKQEARIPEIEKHCATHEIPFDFALDLIAQMCLHKRAQIGVFVGILRHHFLTETNPSQACADMILKAAEVDLVDIRETDFGAFELVLKLDVPPEVREEIEQYQYPLPMVVQPAHVHNNTDIGMFTIRGSIILKDNHHDGDVCLEHINRVNKTAFAINPDTVRLVRNRWKDLDHQRPDEDQEDYLKRVKAFEKYDRVSRDVVDMLSVEAEPFYLTHRYDKRGRTYAQGYHINPQGNDWNKAVVEFAYKEALTA